MNTDKKLIVLGIGASLAAAFCTYKLSSSKKQPKTKKKTKKEIAKRVVDVEGCSMSGLSDVDITIINGEDGTQPVNQDQFTETSVPLSRVNYQRQKQIIRGVEVESVTSSDVTETIVPKHQKANRGRQRSPKKQEPRSSSVDSEEERFLQWQTQREQHLKAKNYVKNDKVYCEEDVSTKENDNSIERKKLNKFVTKYRKSRLRNRNNSANDFQIKKHLSEINGSLTEMCQSEKGSVYEEKSVVSKPDSLVNLVEQKSETNFFDIFLAISKPIVDDKKPTKRKLKKPRRKMRTHSNAYSEPNFNH
jgi:hypothetical protein